MFSDANSHNIQSVTKFHFHAFCEDGLGDSQSSIQGNLDDSMGGRSSVRISGHNSLRKAFDKLPQNQDTKSAFEVIYAIVSCASGKSLWLVSSDFKA